MARHRKMIQRKNWDQFINSGLLWFVNRMLHLVGWAIIAEVDAQGRVTQVYPARVKFRGFSEKTESKGFRNVSNMLKKLGPVLAKEAAE